MRHRVPNRTIVLRSADGRDFLRLAAVGRDDGYPSLEVRAEGMARGFSGGAEAWIDGFDLKNFTAALRAFHQKREGSVELRSMSPDDLRLSVRSAASDGRLVVEFAISKAFPVGNGPETAPVRVSGAFELDPATLGEVAAGFAQLANALAA
jgi:hypothetical protein